jgi:hypothetical protein
MKLKSIPIFITFMLFFSTVFSQQGKYVRKSVSSLNAVWIKPGAFKDEAPAPSRTETSKQTSSKKKSSISCSKKFGSYDNEDLNTFFQSSYDLCDLISNSVEELDNINDFVEDPVGWMSIEASKATSPYKETLRDVAYVTNNPNVAMEGMVKAFEKSIKDEILKELEKAVVEGKDKLAGSKNMASAAKDLDGYKNKLAAAKDVSTAAQNYKNVISQVEELQKQATRLVDNFNDLLSGEMPSPSQTTSNAKSDNTSTNRNTDSDASIPSSTVNMDMFNHFMKFYIEVPRFDFNQLPKNQIEAFVSEANSLSEVNTEKLSEVMSNTIVKDILRILNDPDVKLNRGKNLKSEADLQSFAATKAKSLGLTTDELKVLMNSAYIYLPFVTKFVTKQKGDDLTLNIEGGIIWWQLKISPNGEIEVEKVLDASTTAVNTIDLTATDIISGEKKEYTEYSFADKTFKTTPQTYVQGDAMLAFAKNLSVKTKELSDFKLQAQVLEKTNQVYGFKLGYAEGVHLDDGFFLIEVSEDENGNEVSNQAGFLRIAKTGNNNEDRTALSLAKQLYGEDGDIGSLVMEHPRLGMDVRARFGLKSGLRIPAEYTLGILEKDVASATMLDIDFSYNLAPIINKSQTFLDFGFSIGFPNAALTQEAIELKVGAGLWDIGMGVSKKFWMGRTNIPVGVMINYQSFSLGSSDFQFNISSLGLSLTSGFEYMFNANTVFHAGVEMNMSTRPGRLSITYEGEEIASLDDPDAVAEIYPELFIGGWNFKVGIDYALGELPFDLFGFLDPLKKY